MNVKIVFYTCLVLCLLMSLKEAGNLIVDSSNRPKKKDGQAFSKKKFGDVDYGVPKNVPKPNY